MIRIEGLNAGYGPLQVLRDITLDVGEGKLSRFWAAMVLEKPL